MLRVGIIVLALVVSAVPAAAGHDKTDVVTTHDGSTYVGEIKSVQYATLNLNTNPAGLISIEWRYVTGLTSKFEYRVEVTGGARHFGTLGPPKEPGNFPRWVGRGNAGQRGDIAMSISGTPEMHGKPGRESNQ